MPAAQAAALRAEAGGAEVGPALSRLLKGMAKGEQAALTCAAGYLPASGGGGRALSMHVHLAGWAKVEPVPHTGGCVVRKVVREPAHEYERPNEGAVCRVRAERPHHSRHQPARLSPPTRTSPTKLQRTALPPAHTRGGLHPAHSAHPSPRLLCRTHAPVAPPPAALAIGCRARCRCASRCAHDLRVSPYISIYLRVSPCIWQVRFAVRTLDGALVESGGGWADPEAVGGGEAEGEPLSFEQGDVLGAAVLPCIDAAVREMKMRSRLASPLSLPYISPTSPRCAR